MKTLVVAAAGAADRPVAELGGRTPLEAAMKPCHAYSVRAVHARQDHDLTVTPCGQVCRLARRVGKVTQRREQVVRWEHLPLERVRERADLGAEVVLTLCVLREHPYCGQCVEEVVRRRER